MARSSSRPLVLAGVGGGILVVGIVVFTVVSMTGGSDASETASPTAPPVPSFDPSDYSTDELEYVYPQIAEFGLVPEPITDDPEEYIRAAVAAYGTFDTTAAPEGKKPFVKDAWLSYLESWQVIYPDVIELPESGPIRFDQTNLTAPRKVTEIIGKDADWDQIIDKEGKVMTEVSAVTPPAVDPADPVPADLMELKSDVEFTQWISYDDGTDGEHDITFTKQGKATVIVNCTYTVPAQESAQQPGDCKLVSVRVTEYE